MKISRGFKISLFVILLLIIDQIIKILVKTNMTLGQSIPVFGSWFQILFIENNGMAFGMQFGGNVGKFILSIFRVVLVIAIIIYIRKLLKREETPTGVLIGLGAILCGALGNIIDSLFYGMIFSESTPIQVAELFPPGGGYSGFLFGKVVDMFYFPIIDTTLPEWVPVWGGRNFIFFRPIFNFADACITCGAIYLLIFKWKFFSKQPKTEESDSAK
ncbi:MAG TPA: lipoprotein signal peptidase [Bacteroidales bacterium]|nr:lipoprotein signal peptidase [Bacteroidales bacterium]HPK30184.1 lipoprotein signal peptidase [Bacteroidales bacterium]